MLESNKIQRKERGGKALKELGPDWEHEQDAHLGDRPSDEKQLQPKSEAKKLDFNADGAKLVPAFVDPE
ncbi:hypothetical protein KW801_01970 [Candidatus Saccharibacteria bacterium]|nr:hypothetical protein [Candidatus Saccharibacteria bacterium]